MSGLLIAYNLAYADYPSNNVRNIFRRRNDDYNRLSPKVLKNNRLKTVAKERELSSEAHKRTRQLSKFEQSKVITGLSCFPGEERTYDSLFDISSE